MKDLADGCNVLKTLSIDWDRGSASGSNKPQDSLLVATVVATILEWDHSWSVQPTCVRSSVGPASFAQCRWASDLESSRLRNHTGNKPDTTNYQRMFVGKYRKMRGHPQIFDASRSERQMPEVRTSLYTVHAYVGNKWVGLMIVHTRHAQLAS